MAKRRRDSKGIMLKKGESERAGKSVRKKPPTQPQSHIGDNLSYLYAAPHKNGAFLVHWCKIM